MTSMYLCDGCGKNLSTTDHFIDYRLALKSEVVTKTVPTGTTSVPNPLAQDAYFCGWVCLEKWLEKRRESNG